MIGFVEGIIEYIDVDKIVVNNNGVGYNVFMPASQIDTLNVDETVRVFTYLNVREDAMQLFGFLTRDDLEVFKLLITVNGIGPKGGLAVLSTITTDDLRVAVISEDAKAISKAPGIGAKTAQKVIIELKDKLNLEDVLEPKLDANFQVNDNNSMSEAVMALVALGYSQADAYRAVKSIDNIEELDVENVIKMALKKIY
ncbi:MULTISPECIES: Holliday junction branch migration protein RuvA [unclassified Eubacterium (in: firmicutes)]|uniref:Holliday junction branch migration protein RuvA n=1 Tax=Eubacterium TaxID=1730 RepID=UPI000E4B40E0|nr:MULTISPECIES: Holliday junction branch migration protein RuvA [unclassified Eubacterium (in: firmicutes)]MCJ7965924.1 Holliday junction branch migration protein RuvA [Lachnospiraceae bacterium NSJ-171]MEE0294425.1 Holliday junction branch migration protein RuvA [Eubacterium sp.]RHR36503.1 Holliday junction branch migration protein RuvA [Eubacterium sp. AF19-12LB]